VLCRPGQSYARWVTVGARPAVTTADGAPAAFFWSGEERLRLSSAAAQRRTQQLEPGGWAGTVPEGSPAAEGAVDAARAGARSRGGLPGHPAGHRSRAARRGGRSQCHVQQQPADRDRSRPCAFVMPPPSVLLLPPGCVCCRLCSLSRNLAGQAVPDFVVVPHAASVTRSGSKWLSYGGRSPPHI